METVIAIVGMAVLSLAIVGLAWAAVSRADAAGAARAEVARADAEARAEGLVVAQTAEALAEANARASALAKRAHAQDVAVGGSGSRDEFVQALHAEDVSAGGDHPAPAVPQPAPTAPLGDHTLDPFVSEDGDEPLPSHG